VAFLHPKDELSMRPRLVFFLVLGLLPLVLTGCTTDEVGRTVPVRGKVTVKGQPLKRGSVAFWPDDAKGNKTPFTAAGQINEDGTYELSTKSKPGAPPGAYKVTVTAQTEVDSTNPEKAKSLVPPIYTTKEKTPLAREVVENAAAGTYDLDLK
jgi:hypothetical protein